MATKLQKEIDRLARAEGYPQIKLSHTAYMDILQQAHDNVYLSAATSHTVHTEQEQEGLSNGEHTPGKLFAADSVVMVCIKTEGDPQENTWHVAKCHSPLSQSQNKNGTDEAKANAARIVKTWNEYDNLKAENEKVKRLLHDLTPGGSEFYNDPEYCAKWIRENRQENHYTLAGIIKETKAENEALKVANKELYAALKDLTERADRARGILQSESSPSKGYWGVLDTQSAKEALNNNLIK